MARTILKKTKKMAGTEEAMLDTAENADQRQGERIRTGRVAVGSLLGAVSASSCCILPLVLFSLGAGGAWIGNLTALAPYQPIFITITLGFLAYGFYAVYWKPKRVCTEGAACARPLPNQTVKAALWLATAIVIAATAFPYVAPWLLGS